jgi:LysR family transcriptional regulator for bpeEF and oprC
MDRLQALRVFVRVAELGSFTRAADALELSRARVSEAVAALESELGARLLHRTTRRVALSDDGRAYYTRVRQILAELDDVDASLARTRGSARGRLHVAMPMALARHFVVPALPRLLKSHPDLELEVRLENRALDLLAEGIDCAISYGAPADEGLVVRRVAETQLLTCAAPGYLAARGEPRRPEELVGHDCIAFLSLAAARPVEWRFAGTEAATVHRPSGSLAFNSMEACVDAAAAGLGITQVLSLLAHDALRAKKLRAILGPYVASGPPLYVVYPPNRHLSARLRVLRDFLTDVFARAERGIPRV